MANFKAPLQMVQFWTGLIKAKLKTIRCTLCSNIKLKTFLLINFFYSILSAKYFAEASQEDRKKMTELDVVR